jgi:hypothetical protein
MLGPTVNAEDAMSAEKPSFPPAARDDAQLMDLPVVPVDASEAEGVKGGATLLGAPAPTLLPPNPCAPDPIASIRPGIITR